MAHKKETIVKSHFRTNRITGQTTWIPEHTRVKAPLENSSTKLKYQFSIIVPSTDYDQKISDFEFQKRINETKKFFSSTFGGTTSIGEMGSYVSDSGKLIYENGVKVESSMTEEQYKNNINKVSEYIKNKVKDWNQERIGFYFEGDFYVYPSL